MSDRFTGRQFPVDWETRSLWEIVSRVTQRNFVRSENVLTISARDGLISQEEFFNKRVASADLSPYFLLKHGDFVYSKSYSIGYPVGVIRRLERYNQGVVSPLYICFRPNAQLVDSDYLAHYFRSGLMDDNIAWIAKEGSRNHGLLNVGVNDLLAIPVRVPSLVEQRNIVEILNRADEAIRSMEDLIRKFEHARQGIRHDFLTRGIDESGNLRDPVHRPEQFLETPLGLFPRTWTVCALGEIAPKAQYGVSFPLEYGRGVPVLRMNNLHDGEVVLQDIKACSIPIPSHLFLKHGDVLFNRTNSMERVGRTAIWRGPEDRFSFASYLVRLVHDRQIVSSEYLNMWLNQPETQLRIREFATPAVQQVNVNPTNLKRVLIAYPTSKIEQSAICERALAVDDELSRLRCELRKRRLLTQGLMDDLLTGRVRVGASG